MTQPRDRLCAGEPLVLPSGALLLPIARVRTTLHRSGCGAVAFAQVDPHALLLHDTGGGLRLLAAGSAAVSLADLDERLPQWHGLLDRRPG